MGSTIGIFITVECEDKINQETLDMFGDVNCGSVKEKKVK